jgi:hypothetical protein
MDAVSLSFPPQFSSRACLQPEPLREKSAAAR